eukprot:PhF_6_TR28351/c0_g1_i1/m.42038
MTKSTSEPLTFLVDVVIRSSLDVAGQITFHVKPETTADAAVHYAWLSLMQERARQGSRWGQLPTYQEQYYCFHSPEGVPIAPTSTMKTVYQALHASSSSYVNHGRLKFMLSSFYLQLEDCNAAETTQRVELLEAESDEFLNGFVVAAQQGVADTLRRQHMREYWEGRWSTLYASEANQRSVHQLNEDEGRRAIEVRYLDTHKACMERFRQWEIKQAKLRNNHLAVFSSMLMEEREENKEKKQQQQTLLLGAGLSAVNSRKTSTNTNTPTGALVQHLWNLHRVDGGRGGSDDNNGDNGKDDGSTQRKQIARDLLRQLRRSQGLPEHPLREPL